MLQHLDLGPVELSYAAALRGVVPRRSGEHFHDLRCGAVDVEEMLCLAASNPEGAFTIIGTDAAQATKAQEQAQQARLSNISFLAMTPQAWLQTVQSGTQNFAAADYLVATWQPEWTDADQTALLHLADRLVKEGGLFVYRYPPFADREDGLRFMLAEFGPAMQPAQYQEFLGELRQLGAALWTRKPALGAAIDAALHGDATTFMTAHGLGAATGCRTLDVMAGLAGPRFAFVGDGRIRANYLEMAIAPDAQDMLFSLRGHLLYEPIKDFVADQNLRVDIWARMPAQLSAAPSQLFGYFNFGIVDLGNPPPETMTVNGQVFDLSGPLYARLLKLMQIMPLTIGDFLDHPDGEGFTPDAVVAAVQLLVALGIVAPMRGSFNGMGAADINWPRLAGQFNQRLRQREIGGHGAWLASTVAGRPMRLQLREALVLQALDRAGMAEAADALWDELQRLASDPSLASSMFANGQLEQSFVENLIKETCAAQMVNWYALGILDAA